jgi:hypothetical protein
MRRGGWSRPTAGIALAFREMAKYFYPTTRLRLAAILASRADKRQGFEWVRMPQVIAKK